LRSIGRATNGAGRCSLRLDLLRSKYPQISKALRYADQSLACGMAQEHGIDTKHVFVLGYSNGGQMAFRLAIETPDEVAAVAALGASLPTPDASSCAQRGPYGARHAGEWYPGPHQPI
jgi:dienelactone hydrolase